MDEAPVLRWIFSDTGATVHKAGVGHRPAENEGERAPCIQLGRGLLATRYAFCSGMVCCARDMLSAREGSATPTLRMAK